MGKTLNIEGIGGHNIPYKGIVTLPVKIGDSMIDVPFLLTEEEIQQPILGFNVVETVVKEKGTDEVTFQNCFKDLNSKKAQATVNFLKTDLNPILSQVNTLKQGVTCPFYCLCSCKN